jgi:hypothetical protein
MLPDGRVMYELKHRWRYGTIHVVFKRMELQYEPEDPGRQADALARTSMESGLSFISTVNVASSSGDPSSR